MEGKIEKFEDAFKKLNINRGNQHVIRQASHQPCILLAVIEAIEQGAIDENVIRYEPRLLERFDRYSDIVTSVQTGRKKKAYYPFVFLDAKEFWNLHLMDGRPALDTWQARNKLGSSSHHKVQQDTDFVSLAPDLYACLCDDPTARRRLRATLIDTWLPGHKKELWAAIRSASKWAADRDFETKENNGLSSTSEGKPHRIWREIESNRDPKFRDAVLSAYGYQCAATGWRFEAVVGRTLLEAAHIIPLHQKPDNRPQNGMALTPTIHQAMDAHLIAPGPDLCWHASRVIKKASEKDSGAKWLASFDQRPIRLPPEVRFHPTKSVLEWRMEQLGSYIPANVEEPLHSSRRGTY